MSGDEAFTSAWSRLADTSYIIRIIDTTLRSCAQVMLQNNPLTGLIFFLAIFYAAWDANNMAAAWGCLLGTVTATLTGMVLKDNKSWRSGLYSYNGCLFGVALPMFIVATPQMWACLVGGSILSVIITVSIADILKTWKISALTAPFVLVTWVILLSSYVFSGLYGSGLAEPVFPHHYIVEPRATFAGISWANSLLNGVSQIFLLQNGMAGILLILGLALSSLSAAIFALMGSLLATLVSILLGADFNGVESGIYAFSAVLTSVSLGTAFNQPSLRVVVWTLAGVLFTVFNQVAMGVLLTPVGLPALTLPFVLSSWLFLVPNKEFLPAHRRH